MTSGQDVSEYLDTLGLVKSYFSSFLRKKNKKIEKKKCHGAPTPQRIRRFLCLQDCLLTLTCHLACEPNPSDWSTKGKPFVIQQGNDSL